MSRITHPQACATAFLNVRLAEDPGAITSETPPGWISWTEARRIMRFSIMESDAAIGRLLAAEFGEEAVSR